MKRVAWASVVVVAMTAACPAAGSAQGFEHGVGTGPSQELSTPPNRRQATMPARAQPHRTKAHTRQAAPAGGAKPPG